MPSFVTTAEAAEILGVSPRTIRRRIQDGSLRKAPLSGRAVRIPTAELSRLAYAEAPSSRANEANIGDDAEACLRGQNPSWKHPDESIG